MRESNDGFTVDDDDLYIPADDDDLIRWSHTRTCLLPVGRKYDPDDPSTATWNPQITKVPLEFDDSP